MKKSVLLVILGVLALASCKKDTRTQKEKDVDAIQDYLKENNLEAQSTASGIYYIIDKKGSGPAPTDSSMVTVEYTGKLLNGEVFDQGLETFPLKDLIEGWKEGLKLFNQGGKGKLFIPSKLAYGDRKVGKIPPNSVLIFEVDLIYVE
jgi:FKBP-type peptidyl-prolyl cis-trans isomerase FkpA